MASVFKFDISKLKHARLGDGTQITTFKVRETNGEDEEIAAKMAKAKDGVTAAEEQAKLSITEVNGAAVVQPYLAFDKWTSQARVAALRAFIRINGVEDKEAEGFLEAAEVCE